MSVLEPGRPCTFCDVRPDIACRHRPADPDWRRIERPTPDDKRAFNGGTSGHRSFVDRRTGKTMRIQGK